MKHICNAAKEGRCTVGPGKCSHRRQHSEWYLCKTGVSCTKERFCEAQNIAVRCVEVKLFPAMKNPITVSDELAREFVDWAEEYGEWVASKGFCNSGQHICDRLATRFEEQLK